MSVAVEEVPAYPSGHTQAILPGLVAEGFTGQVPRFEDPAWSLSPLPHGPGASRPAIRWDSFPPAFREEMRYLTWLLINTSLPAGFLIGKHSRWRTTVSPGHIYPTVTKWRAFCRWLDEQGRTSLGDCDPADLRAYALHLTADRGTPRTTTQKVLAALTRLWALDSSNPFPAGLCEPPWLSEGADDFLPAGSSTGENATEPITPATMGPLLMWALRVVDDFSHDILAAIKRKDEILTTSANTPPTEEGGAALEKYLGDLITAGISPPTMAAGNRRGLAAKYISSITGASVRQVHHQVIKGPWRTQLMSAAGPAPLITDITGTIDGLPWTESIDYAEVDTLKSHLTTACYIVISYLTGMRPREIQGLEKGCCPDPQAGRHLIRSAVFKTALDDNGNHIPQGVTRDVPWVAIDPVVRAIRTAEEMKPEGYLFGGVSADTMNSRIEKFIHWASALAKKFGRPEEVIPDDKYGSVGVSRFRRTLAWHIARRPGGLVALAIQYGHLRTAMSAGYASRSRDGIHDLLDVETALAVADTLAAVNEEITNGSGISGPAARRAISAATHAAEFAGTIVNARQARALLQNPSLAIYDNPSAMLMCVYKPDRALCNRVTSRTSPRLDRCVSTCSNIARADSHAQLMREEAESLEQQASQAPGPLGDRMRTRAQRLRDEAEQHDLTRVSPREAQ
ncbi:integrase [Kitasatospora cinereorecta]|uniref:Integrase n=1 Tax=Kitasatospora cinereorecta TaxID=285560 RepID=A0ABW0VMF0_9ACTN